MAVTEPAFTPAVASAWTFASTAVEAAPTRAASVSGAWSRIRRFMVPAGGTPAGGIPGRGGGVRVAQSDGGDHPGRPLCDVHVILDQGGGHHPHRRRGSPSSLTSSARCASGSVRAYSEGTWALSQDLISPRPPPRTAEDRQRWGASSSTTNTPSRNSARIRAYLNKGRLQELPAWDRPLGGSRLP